MSELARHSLQSSLREKILEHIFIGDLLRVLWAKGATDIELLRTEVDSGGYDLVVECRGVTRHVQLKASYAGASVASVNINCNLLRKPSGCIVWMRFDPKTIALGPFYWLGAAPGSPLVLPENCKIAKHTKGNAQGIKAERPNIRTVPRRAFTHLPDMESLVAALFGPTD